MSDTPEVYQIRDAEVRVFDQEPGTDDASDMYVIEALGVTVRIRRVGKGRLTAVIESEEHVDIYLE